MYLSIESTIYTLPPIPWQCYSSATAFRDDSYDGLKTHKNRVGRNIANKNHSAYEPILVICTRNWWEVCGLKICILCSICKIILSRMNDEFLPSFFEKSTEPCLKYSRPLPLQHLFMYVLLFGTHCV